VDKVKFKISVGSRDLQIIPRLRGDLRKFVASRVRFRVEGYQFTKAYERSKQNWDGFKTFLRQGAYAPAGCYKRIAEALAKKGHQVIVGFENNYVPKGGGKIHWKEELDKFQIEASKRVVKFKYCIIEAVVRSGKTPIIAQAISDIDHYPVCVLTKPDKVLTAQIRDKLGEYLGREIGILSEGKLEFSDIIVSNYQAMSTVLKLIREAKAGRKEVKEKTQERNEIVMQFIRDTKVLMLDECHRALAPVNQELLKQFRSAGYKIGFSGTARPDGVSMVELEAAIGPIVQRVKFETVIKAGRIAQPVVIIYDLPDNWFSGYLSYYEDVYESDIVRNPMRNKFIAEVVENLKKANLNSFIAVSIVEHGNLLRREIPGSFFVHGGIKTKTRREIYKSLEEKELYCMIGTVGKEGLDLPRLDAVINAEGYSSSVATTQKMRSLTASEKSGKRFGFVFDFTDKERIYLEKASKEREKKYRSFKGFIVKKRTVPPDHFGTRKNKWL
jgi:superfamily II DNA or RNA helicase